ncbi:hypothetical protein QJS10_CPB17g01216 [Acorus calamus]|uniref:Uncharacterized protein n=1 Tax=Acorus calamus TaxID=4465 RepID=A0AAV9CT01_ACOCL|nr:hypothetical protein QJS10_CPB17g01216 [Acorus calamus]
MFLSGSSVKSRIINYKFVVYHLHPLAPRTMESQTFYQPNHMIPGILLIRYHSSEESVVVRILPFLRRHCGCEYTIL